MVPNHHFVVLTKDAGLPLGPYKHICLHNRTLVFPNEVGRSHERKRYF